LNCEKYGDNLTDFSVANSGIKDGLNTDRTCTDVLCLIVFAAFLFSMGFCTFYGYKNGNVNTLIAPLDGDKNFCGIDRTMFDA
jgi:hypothetical protein